MKHLFLSAKQFGATVCKTCYIYKNIWKESTIFLLHAPRNVNKTDRALDISIALSETGRKVLYINIDKSLDAYADVVAEYDNISVFNPRFESSEDKTDYAEIIFDAIEKAVATTSVRTFVVDSVSRISALSFGRNASASYIMKRLVALQVKHGISVLAVAHDMNVASTRAIVSLADTELNLTNEQPEDACGSFVKSQENLAENKSVDNDNIVNDESEMSTMMSFEEQPKSQKSISDHLGIALRHNVGKKRPGRNRNKRKSRA